MLTLLTYGKIKARIETQDGAVAHFLGLRNDLSGILFLAAKIPAIKPERMLISRMNQVSILERDFNSRRRRDTVAVIFGSAPGAS